MPAPYSRAALRAKSDKQLSALLYRICRIMWERYGVEPWPEEAEQPEALETLTSACEEIESLVRQ